MTALSGARLPRSFFTRPTLLVAPRLLGAVLVTVRRGVRTAGRIVEVEAYGGVTPDPACHAHSYRTERNEVMFWAGGHCYVYFIYGMHFCVNVVTEQRDRGAAVLIRALEPLEGIESMRRRRGGAPLAQLTNGPGKLCRALGIQRALCGEDLVSSSKIFIERGIRVPPKQIEISARIGITKAAEYPWRFFVRGNCWVSKR